MDLKTITDIEKLESLAYKQGKIIYQAQSNIQLIEQRIAELSAQHQDSSGATGMAP